MSKVFYITTAIDYPNGAPHMGHAYEKIVTDTYARWSRFIGNETYFLTGTDENGQKLVKAAQDAGQPTQKYVDEQSQLFRKLCKDLQLSNDGFIRTTDPKHKKTAQEIWSRLEKRGDIYQGTYEGLYCLACENFYSESQTENSKCPVHGTPLDKVKEEGFFFKLSAYADWVANHIRADKSFVWPESARKEMLGRIEREPVKDLSVSRPNAGWGIPIPGHEKFVMYTWFDALINYAAEHFGTPNFEKFWPNAVHVIGKDITWFHTVIWPAMLKAAELPLPKQVYVHGMVLGEDGRKMSKSLGNGVDPYQILEKFPLDSFRYYILRAIPSGSDGAFVTADLIKRHNSELANDFGNLLMRVVKLSLKKLPPNLSTKTVQADFDFVPVGEKMRRAMENFEHHVALETLWLEINKVNLYINDNAPWKKEGADFERVIVNSLYALHCMGALMQAFLPGIGAKTLEFLGTKAQGLKSLEFQNLQFQLSTPDALFPKIDA